MVTYNQEDYIRETLESLFNQTELPNEVVLSDDCSTDGTWDIICEYEAKFPHILKAYRNEPNLGIFKNIAKVREYATGNVCSFLSGDDLYKPQTIEKVNTAIRENKLNPTKDRFIIALNSIHLYPNGLETIWNNYVERNKPLLGLRLRYGLSYRGVGLSKPLFEVVSTESDILKINPNFKLNADWIKGFEEVTKTDNAVFVDYAGPVYRLGSGITSGEKLKESTKSRKEVTSYIKQLYGKEWTKSDLLFFKFLENADNHTINPSIGNFAIAFYYWILNFNNFSPNFPWIREAKRFIPPSFLPFFKYRIYPVLQKVRGR